MSTAENKAVFLSYASQDAEAARKICDALRAAGVEVWFDQSELVGGDAWDQKIRRQIRECALLIPIISKATQGRREAYFRLEWKLADERTHLMARGTPFLLPVTIDETSDRDALVPDSFLAVQWTKAPGGEAPVAFGARVKRLLDGSPVGGALRPDSGHEPKQSGHKAPPTVAHRFPWLMAAGLLLVFVIAALALKQPWRSELPRVAPDAPAKTAAPQNEAQKLVAQAAQMLDNGDELNREVCFLAEDLVKRALALEPANAPAAALAAEISYRITWFGFDRTRARFAMMRQQAERALALAPQSVEARLAHAEVMTGLSENLSGAVTATLQLAREVPGNWRVQRALAEAYRELKQSDAALAAYQKAQQLSGGDPAAAANLVNYLLILGRTAEAETVVNETLARRTGSRLLAHDVLLKTQWRGDTAAATAALAQWPEWLLREDRGAHLAWRAWYWHRQPDRALAAAQLATRDYLRDAYFSGPRAALTALAQEMAGHPEAAQADWREVVELTNRELVTDSQDASALYWKAWALDRLGDHAGARAIGALIQQRNLPATANIFRFTPIAPLWATLGQPDDAVADLQSRFAVTDRYAVNRAMLELDPTLAPLRTDPRFAELLKRAPAPASSSLLLAPARPPEADAKSVAVLAFANLSDDKGNEYFSDGISEELLNQLGKVTGLRVAGRTSAFSFKGQNIPEQEIARKLGVAYVVNGSIQRSGTQVRITARLVSAADGFQVWSEKFTRDLKDIFAVQDEIAGLIAQNLQLKLAATDRAKRVVNPEAYRLVLEGRQFWNFRTEEGFTKAEAAFAKALTIDPQFAEAHAGLAGVSVIRAVYRELDGLAVDEEDLRRAEREGQRALEIDPASAEAHAALGYGHLLANRLGESDRHFQQALALSPNSALVHCWYALLLAAQGRLDVAIQHYQQAADLDPLWFINLQMLGGTLAYAHRFDEALATIERAASLRTDVFVPNPAERAKDLLALGRKEEALAAARYVLAHPDDRPRWISDAIAIRVLREGGRRQEAEDAAARMFARWAPDNYLRGFTLAAMGRFDEALPYLKYTPSSMYRSLYWDPVWDPWREDPRFLQLFKDFNRAAEYQTARATLARMLHEQKARQ